MECQIFQWTAVMIAHNHTVILKAGFSRSREEADVRVKLELELLKKTYPNSFSYVFGSTFAGDGKVEDGILTTGEDITHISIPEKQDANLFPKTITA